MSDDRSRRGLRRAIDDSADELGEDVTGELPASADEIRRRLPDTPPTEPSDSDSREGGRPLQTAIAESPVGNLLE